MSDDTVTLHVGAVSVFCGPTLDEARITSLRDAIPRVLENWSDVIDLLRTVQPSPTVQLALGEGQVWGLIDLGRAAAIAIKVPAKATGYDVLAKILRELEYQCAR